MDDPILDASIVVRRPRRLVLLELADVPDWRPSIDEYDIADACEDFDEQLAREKLVGSIWRAVSVTRLSAVMSSGTDVDPADAPFSADRSIEKALEYGGWPKLLLALRPRFLDRSFRRVRSDTPTDELGRLKQTFPNSLTSDDGRWLWLSRCRPPLHPEYEHPHGYWIPRAPGRALRAAFVLSHPRYGGRDAAVTAISSWFDGRRS